MTKFLEKLKAVAFFIFFLLVLYFGVFSKVINAKEYQSQIKKIVETSFENPAEFGQFHSELTWNLGVKINIDKGAILHKDGSDFVSSGPLSFEISLPYLLMKNKYKIRKIEFKNPVFIIKRFKNGHFDIEELFISKNKVVLDKTKIVISDYKIFFADEIIPQETSFFILGKNLKISDFNPDKFIKIQADGEIMSINRDDTVFDFEYSTNLPLDKKQLMKNNLRLKGAVENLYLDMYLPYVQSVFPHYSYLSGVVNSDFDINLRKNDFWKDIFKFKINAENFIAKNQDKIEVLRSSGLLQIDVCAKRKKHKLFLEKLSINSSDINLKLNGNIKKVDSKNPELNLKLFVKNTEINAISYLFPYEINAPNDVFEYLKKFKFKSKTNGNVEIKGTSKHPILFGDLIFADFYIVRNSKAISDGTLKINFAGKTYNIDAELWSNPKEPPLYVKGNITPQLRKISLGVTSAKIEFAPVQQFLFAIRDIFKLNIGYFVSNTIFDGKGSGNVYIYGNTNDPYMDGYINFFNCKLAYSGLSQSFKNVNGKLRLHKDNVYFNNIKASIAQSPFLLNGQILKSTINLIFDFPKLNASEAVRMINESSDLVTTKARIKDMKAISGYAIAKLIFDGDAKKNLRFKAFNLDILGASVTYEQVGVPVKLIKGKIFINDVGTFFDEVKAEILGAPAEISGCIFAEDDIITQDYVVNIKKFNAEKIKYITASSTLSVKIKKLIRNLKNSKGFFDVDLSFLPTDNIADFRFYNTSFVYEPYDLPIEFQNGRLITTSNNLEFESMNGRLANSPFYFDGTIENYQKNPFFNLELKAKADSEDVTKYINPYLKLPINSKGSFPIIASIKGGLNSWKFSGQMALNKGDYVYFKHDLGLPLDKVRMFKIDATGGKDNIVVDDFSISEGEKHLDLSDFSQAQQQNILSAKGGVKQFGSKQLLFEGFSVNISRFMNIKFLNSFFVLNSETPFFDRGYFKGNIRIQGPMASLNALGFIEFKDVILKNIAVNHAIVNLNSRNMSFDGCDVEIAGQKLKIVATANKNFSLPLTIIQMQILASKFDIEDFIKSMPKTSSKKPFPIIVENGFVHVDELIWKNIIAQNFSSSLSLGQNGLFCFPNLQFNFVNGCIKGNIFYNQQNTESGGNISARGLLLTSLVKLFHIHNGKLSGNFNADVGFCSKGKTRSEIIKNTKVVANFNIQDGYSEKLEKVEHLLIAKNTLLTGIGNISFNKVLNLLFPENLGAFKTFNGTIIVQNGLVISRNLSYKSENMNLYAKGNFKVAQKQSDVIALGQLYERKKLGKIGDVSVGVLLRFIPGASFLPHSLKTISIIGVLPLFNKPPFFNEVDTKKTSLKYKNFIVRILAKKHCAKNFGSFEWFDKLSEREKEGFSLE